MHQIRFPLGLCPDPARGGGGLTALLRPIAIFKGPILLRGGRRQKRGEKGQGEDKGEKRRGRETLHTSFGAHK